MKHLAAVMVVMAVVVACASPAPSPIPTASANRSPSGTPPPITPSPTATPLTETVLCVPEASATASTMVDPCPPAIAAVHNVIAPLGLPIARMVLQPQPFDCGDLWPGVGSPAICYGPFVMPGTTMHGWVSFTGSAKVAAVSLHLQPATGPSPAPSPMWVATIAAFQIPPAGWVMP
jgi:hypothetical protein